jgi:TP901 family phage tail tape measure protein
MSAEAFALRGVVVVDERDAEKKLVNLEQQAEKTYIALNRLSAGRTGTRVKSDEAMGRQLQRLEQDLGKARVDVERRVANQTLQIRKATSVAEVREATRLAQAQAKEKTKIERAQLSEASRNARTEAQLQSRESIQFITITARAKAQVERDLSRDLTRLELERNREAERMNRLSVQQKGRLEIEAARQRGRVERDEAQKRVRLERDTQRQIEAMERDAERSRRASMARLDQAAKAAAAQRAREAREQTRLEQQTAKAMDGQRKQRATARSNLAGSAGDGASVAGASVLAGLGAAANEAIEFDRSLRNVNSIAQLTNKQLSQLSDSLMVLASDKNVRQGPKDLADALIDVYSVGFKGAKALEILKMSAYGAAAGATDVKTAVDALTGVLMSGVKGGNNAKVALDTLFQTVLDGKVNFTELNGALGQTLPFLKAGGVSLQEYGAYMAVATSQSQKAEFATNNFNNLISKLAAPPKEAAKQFDALGIKYGFAEIQGKGLSAKMTEILAKTKGQDDALKKLFPDMQAFSGAQTALTGKMARYNEELDKHKKSSAGAGAAALALSKQNEGGAYEMDRFIVNLKTFAILTGDTVIPALNTLLRSTKPIFDAFRSLSPETRETTVKLVAFGAVLLLVGGRAKAAVDIYTTLKTATIAVRATTVGATLATNAQTVATGRLGVGLGALRARMIATTAATAAQTAGFWSLSAAGSSSVTRLIRAFGPWGVALAAIAVTVWGIRTAIIGTKDAGTMSADALIKKWGILGSVWVKGGDALGRVLNFLNRAALQKGDNAEAQSLALSKKMSAPGIQRAPKSKAFLNAHPGYVDGSHSSGLERVPKDGYIAELHKNEAVLTAPEAAKWRRRKSELTRNIGDLQSQIDTRQIANSKTKGRSKDTQLLEWRIQLRDLKTELRDVKRELGETTRTAVAATRRMVKTQIDELGNASKSWRDYAQSIEIAADKRIDALKATREAAAVSVQGLESRLVDSGAMSEKGVAQGFYSRVAKLERLLNSKPLDALYATSRAASKRANERANGYDGRAESLQNAASSSGGSGSEPGFTSPQRASLLGSRVASVAEQTVAKRAGTDIGGKCLFWVQMVLQRTLKGAELAAFKRIAFGVGSAKNAGNNLKQAGLAKSFAEVGYDGLRPGDVLFDNQGKNGHAGIYAGKGRVAENNGKRGKSGAQKMSDVHKFVRGIDMVYRPGGWGTQEEVARKAKSTLPTKVVARQGIENAPVVAVDAPSFARVLAQFNLKTLAPLLTKQPKPGDSNEMRRGMLLDLAKLTPALHTEAAQRGFSGDKAVVWVKEVQSALYDLANFAEKPLVDKAQAEKNKAATERRDEARKNVFAEGNSRASQFDLSESLLAQGKSFDEINAALDEQQRLLTRIDELKSAGYKDNEAKRLAVDAQAIDRSNQARADAVEWLQKQQMSVDDVSEVMEKQTALSDICRESQERLSEALRATDGNASDLQSALDAMPETLKQVIAASEAAGASAAGLQSKYAGFFEMLSQARSQVMRRRADEADLPQREGQSASGSRFGEISDDLDYRARMALTFDDKKRRTLDLESEMKRQGLPFEPADIEAVVNKDLWVSKVEGLTSGLHSIFQDSFSNIEGGFSGMCDNVLGSFTKMLQQMAAQYLANFVMQQMFGAFTGGVGAMGGDVAKLGMAPIGPQPLASGMAQVPRDNFPAILHKNEAVLNAAQAESWRQQQQAKEVAIAGNSVSARRESSASHGNASQLSAGDVHIHLHGPTNVNANDRQAFAGELMGQRLPRRELQRRVQRGMTG